MDNMPAYRLDPTRGKAQYAMVTVTGKADDVFVVELVQLLSAEEAANARISLLKLLKLAVEINSSTLKRSSPWTIDDSPVKAKNAGSWDAARLENQWVSHLTFLARAIFVSNSSRVAMTSYSQHLMEMSGPQSLLS